MFRVEGTAYAVFLLLACAGRYGAASELFPL
jgi:hypothetical protein